MAAVARLAGVQLAPYKSAQRVEEERERLAKLSVAAFIGSWHALSEWQGTRSRVHALSVPSLVIHGELDAGVIEGSRWLAATISGAALESVPRAGHSPQYERPDLFNAALGRHLRRHASA